MNPLWQIRALGQQIWLDNLSRPLLDSGELALLIADDGIAGVTTNPAIFQKALADGSAYADDLARLPAGLSAEERYEQLAIADVRRACDLLLPTFAAAKGQAGYVSLEVSPALADDAKGTVAAGQRLFAAVGRANLLIKIPATPAGLQAVTVLAQSGINVNITLLFSLEQADRAAEAWWQGVARRQAEGGEVSSAFSVASLFLSRVDTHVDAHLPEGSPLRGKAAVAMAKLAWQRWQTRFTGEAFAALAATGCPPQRLLWASTGTKNPAYSDLLYVEPLIGPDTITTLPDATLAALRDHGKAASTLSGDVAEAEATFAQLARNGIDMEAVGATLLADGLKQFETAYAKLLEQVGEGK
ncbi:MAG: transaldolase [Zoogloeaceae bacterium]|nr:transaldolase [Zoogloeaceae bacterium]